jgi:curved DNA-binding protein CbpA
MAPQKPKGMRPQEPTSQDHYFDLGLPRSAAHSEIKKAFRKLVLIHHPDKKAPGTLHDDTIIKRVRTFHQVVFAPDTTFEIDFLTKLCSLMTHGHVLAIRTPAKPMIGIIPICSESGSSIAEMLRHGRYTRNNSEPKSIDKRKSARHKKRPFVNSARRKKKKRLLVSSARLKNERRRKRRKLLV